MKNFKRIIVAAMALAGVSYGVSAHAGVGVIAGGTFSSPSFSNPDADINTKTGFIGGLVFESTSSEMLGFEGDVLYQVQKYSVNGIENSQNGFQVPLMLRFNFLPIFNIGLGGFATYHIGDVSVNGNDISYADARLKRWDFGAVGSVRLAIPIGSLNFFIDGRYLLGLTNNRENPVGDESVKSRTIQAMAGLKLDM